MSVETSWKDRWIKAKGYAWSKVLCSSHSKLLYNSMVELLLKKTCVFDQDIMWINTQFVVCCNEVRSSFASEKVCYKTPQSVSCGDVIFAFKKCANELDRLDHHKIKVELQRIALCLGIIWLSGKIETSIVTDLLIDCEQITALSFQIDLDVSYVLQKLLCSQERLLKNKRQSDQKSEEVLTSYETEFELVQRCHSEIVYLFFVSVYQKNQYGVLIQMCLDYLSNIEKCPEKVRSLLHNLTACCYFYLDKPHMAIVNWRKAITHCCNPLFLLPLLYNLHRTYQHCEMYQPSIEIIKIIMSIVESNQGCVQHNTSFIFQPSKDGFFELKLQGSQEIKINTAAVAYYSAHYFLKMKKASEAVPWYEYTLKKLKTLFDPDTIAQSCEYKLPITVPLSIQINAEYALALKQSDCVNELLHVDSDDLDFCSVSFRKAYHKYMNNESVVASDNKAFLDCATQLYHCISLVLYKISAAFTLPDPSLAHQLISRSLEALIEIQPTMTGAGDENSCDCIMVGTVLNRLNRAKAMLYFNQALLLAQATNLEMTRILKCLQSVLRHDSNNIDTRWNVTLLLWKIGKVEEAIKTWCKTRSINYKLDQYELNSLFDAKKSSLSSCSSETKRNYLEKDLCILNELLRMVSR